MPRSMMSRGLIWLFSIVAFTAGTAFAQFTASIQGEVKDPSGAGVAKATINLLNTATGVSAVVTGDDGATTVSSASLQAATRSPPKPQVSRSPRQTSPF